MLILVFFRDMQSLNKIVVILHGGLNCAACGSELGFKKIQIVGCKLWELITIKIIMKLHMTGVMDYNRMLYNTDLLKLTGRAVCPQVDLSDCGQGGNYY